MWTSRHAAWPLQAARIQPPGVELPLPASLPLCCCRNRVEPDNQLYGMLMRAAGASGDMSLVLVLAEEMRREGLTPCTVSLWHGQPASQAAGRGSRWATALPG